MFLLLLSILTLIYSPDSNLNQKIDDYLRIKLSGYEKYEYEILRSPAKNSNIKIDKNSQFNISGNLAYVPVSITEKKRTYKSYISLRLKLFKRVYVAAKNIERRADITNKDVKYQLYNVSMLNGTPVTSGDELKSMRSKVTIKKSEALIKEMLEPKPIVFANDKINANSIVGNVMASVPAIARQEGIAGDIISVITLDKKQFKGKIIDSKNILIIE